MVNLSNSPISGCCYDYNKLAASLSIIKVTSGWGWSSEDGSFLR